MATTVAWEPVRVTRTRDDFLLTGDEYRQSLRDGRRVIAADGQDVGDVLMLPQIARGVDTLAGWYDAHFDSETRDRMTYTDPATGKLASLAWKVPRTVEDLVEKRELCRLTTYMLMGAFGRPPDYAPLNPIGFLSLADRIGELNPQWAENVERYVAWGRENCVIETDIGVDVQSDKRIPFPEKRSRLHAVQERPDGLVLSGAKPCTSISPQAHVGTVLTLFNPQLPGDTALFCAVPVNAPGITMVLREPVTEGTNGEDHPLDARGEEIDALMLFEDVFLPSEQIFSYQRMELVTMYHEIGAMCLWHIMSRIAYKAEIYAGTAQLIANVLGTTNIPQVRDAITEITAYATTLMAFCIASEETATLKNGVMVPNERFVTAGRLHSVVHLPRILQLLREISGQGLISRFPRAMFERADIGALLDEFLPGTGCSARAKNRLFNFVWDLTCSSHAMRVALFENVNATPAAVMRNRIYESPYRTEWTERVRSFLGIELES